MGCKIDILRNWGVYLRPAQLKYSQPLWVNHWCSWVVAVSSETTWQKAKLLFWGIPFIPTVSSLLFFFSVVFRQPVPWLPCLLPCNTMYPWTVSAGSGHLSLPTVYYDHRQLAASALASPDTDNCWQSGRGGKKSISNLCAFCFRCI